MEFMELTWEICVLSCHTYYLAKAASKPDNISNRMKNDDVQVFVNDQFLNWDPQNRVKVRIVSARAYHSLFMHNM